MRKVSLADVASHLAAFATDPERVTDAAAVLAQLPVTVGEMETTSPATDLAFAVRCAMHDVHAARKVQRRELAFPASPSW